MASFVDEIGCFNLLKVRLGILYKFNEGLVAGKWPERPESEQKQCGIAFSGAAASIEDFSLLG
jgi:hypothetical protein